MQTVKFDLTQKGIPFKILNATNGGPWHKRHANDQYISNFETYKAAKIPYSRNHDSWYCATYGGPFCHDISAIFPNFDADVNDPKSYDFACTDEEILCTLEAGTKTFFRLGESIDHRIVKHNINMPKDFQKWAEICEHIIRHYNEGWADGFNLNIEYWEIWNEPDLDAEDAEYRRTWTGTRAQFCDMYEIAAKHLKKCFPHLKIGGPAFCGRVEWADVFLCEMQKRNVPMDFVSWHAYNKEPQGLLARADAFKALMVKYGYGDAESNLNEWNYVRGWTDDFKYTLSAIHGEKGASYVMACISEMQYADTVDMAMYYDTRPSAFCGAFDLYTYDPLKGYYPLAWYSNFYDLEASVKHTERPENVYTLCGVDKDGKAMAIVTHYSENDDTPAIDVNVDFGKQGKYEIYRVDKEYTGEKIGETEDLTFNLPVHSFILIKEV